MENPLSDAELNQLLSSQFTAIAVAAKHYQQAVDGFERTDYAGAGANIRLASEHLFLQLTKTLALSAGDERKVSFASRVRRVQESAVSGKVDDSAYDGLISAHVVCSEVLLHLNSTPVPGRHPLTELACRRTTLLGAFLESAGSFRRIAEATRMHSAETRSRNPSSDVPLADSSSDCAEKRHECQFSGPVAERATNVDSQYRAIAKRFRIPVAVVRQQARINGNWLDRPLSPNEEFMLLAMLKHKYFSDHS